MPSPVVMAPLKPEVIPEKPGNLRENPEACVQGCLDQRGHVFGAEGGDGALLPASLRSRE